MGVVLFNFGEEDFAIKEGDRIAQLILEKVEMCEALEVEVSARMILVTMDNVIAFLRYKC